MGIIKDSLDRLTIEVTSPDGTIDAMLTRSEGIELSFERNIENIHTEASLEIQMESVLKALLQGYDHAVDLIKERAYGKEIASLPPTEKQKKFQEAGEEIHLRAISPSSYVVIEWLGKSDFVVHLKKDILHRMDNDRFGSEVNRVLRGAVIAYRNRVAAIHREVYR